MISIHSFPFLPVVFLLVSASSAILLNKTPPEPRDQNQTMSTNATCEAGYDWASNGAGIAPCVMAAALNSCNTNTNHTVPPLTPGNHYDPPSLVNETVNVCQCSWALYNLMSMCTACQGQMSSIIIWASYSVDCKDYTTDSYFPSTVSIPENATIPLYAQSNPTQWTNGIFNVTQAKQIVDSGTLVLPAAATSIYHHAKPTATIIGASVGGVVLLCLIGVVIWFRYFRKREIALQKDNDDIQELHTPTASSRQSTVYYVHTDGRLRGSVGYTILEENEDVPSAQQERPVSNTRSRSSHTITPYTKQYNLLVQSSDDTYAPTDNPMGRRRTVPPSTIPYTQSDPHTPFESGEHRNSAPPAIGGRNISSSPNNSPAVGLVRSPSRQPTGSPPPYSTSLGLME